MPLEHTIGICIAIVLAIVIVKYLVQSKRKPIAPEVYLQFVSYEWKKFYTIVSEMEAQGYRVDIFEARRALDALEKEERVVPHRDGVVWDFPEIPSESFRRPGSLGKKKARRPQQEVGV